MVELANMRCKKCNEELIYVSIGDTKILRPRRMSFCKGYHLNAFNSKTKICKSYINVKSGVESEHKNPVIRRVISKL